jgi:hypothetical protein
MKTCHVMRAAWWVTKEGASPRFSFSKVRHRSTCGSSILVASPLSSIDNVLSCFHSALGLSLIFWINNA